MALSTCFVATALFSGALASPMRRSGSMGKGMGKGSMEMTQKAYLQCTPDNPQFSNPMYCSAGTPSYALDKDGEMIPVMLTRGERGTRMEYLNIDQAPNDYVFSTYNVVFDTDSSGAPTDPLFVGNFRGATAGRNGVRFRDLSLNVGSYGHRRCMHPYSEESCPGMTASPVQRFTMIPSGAPVYHFTPMRVANSYIRFVVKNHGARSALGNPADNSFSNQDQDYELIAQYRLDAPECGADTTGCGNWWIANFPEPSP